MTLSACAVSETTHNSRGSTASNDFSTTPAPHTLPRTLGIVLPKASTQLTNALKATIDVLIAEGTYDDILAKWGQQAGAVTAASIDDGVDPA